MRTSPLLALVLPLFVGATAVPTLAPVADAVGLTRVATALEGFGAANAADIRRNRVKRSANLLYRPVAVTEDSGNGDDTTTVEVAVSYLAPSGKMVDVSPVTTTEPTVERVFFDWTPPTDFDGGIVSLNCVDCDDAFADLPIFLDSAPSWNGGNQDLGDTEIDLRVWHRGNGDYRFRIKGKPADVATLKFSAGGNTPPADLTVNQTSAPYQFTREVWTSNPTSSTVLSSSATSPPATTQETCWTHR